MTRARLAALALLVALLALPACGGGGEGGGSGGGGGPDLTVYSGRNEELVGPLFERFERESGLRVDVRYGESAELAATLAEEGDNSPADVFFSQDAGALGAVEDRLAPLPRPVLAAVPARFRDPRGRWAGVSGRARVIVYATGRLEDDEVPDSVFDLTAKRWRGRVGLAPTNASFQSFVSAMRLDVGEARTREWLEGLRDNEPTRFEGNLQAVEAVGRGEVDLALVNHYYVYEVRAEDPEAPVANHFTRRGDPGSLVNAAGVGILRTSEEAANAARFARFLVSRPAQRYFADTTAEYPLVAGVERRSELPPLDEVVGPGVALGRLGGRLRSTVELLDETGLTR